MFVHLTDRSGKAHVVNSDHVIKCVYRTSDHYWSIQLSGDKSVNVEETEFQTFEKALGKQLAD